MIIAVSGWRNWREKSSVVAVIGTMIDQHWGTTSIPSEPNLLPLFRFGDCETGVDQMIWEIVTEWHLPHERYEADWDQYGKYAGALRNRAMLRGDGHPSQGVKATVLLAFPQPNALPKIPGSGTWGCIGEAAAMGIQTVTYPSTKLTNCTGFSMEVFRNG